MTLAANNEGVGLYEMEAEAFKRLGGTIRFDAGVTDLIINEDAVAGVMVGDEKITADAVVLACGGFEASDDFRKANLVRLGVRLKSGARRIIPEMA